MTPPLLRTSERKDARLCWWLWEQHWLKGISPKRSPTWSVFGTAMHKALEVYYPVGVKRGTLANAIDEFLGCLNGEIRKIGVDIFDEEYQRAEDKADANGTVVRLIPAHELGPMMLRGYVNYWRDHDKQWEVIHTEQPFQINVPDPEFPDETLVVYAGTWDALMRNRRDKRFWLWDHKTAKQIPQPDFLELDDQAGSYLWVAKEVLVHKGVLTEKDKIHGIVFNYLKKTGPDERRTNTAGESLNKDGTVSKRQPTARFVRYPSARSPHQIATQARRVQDEAVVMDMMRNGHLTIYKNPHKDCPRCIIFDMCAAHEAGDDWELIRDELYVVRDPYADHRVAMATGGIEL